LPFEGYVSVLAEPGDGDCAYLILFRRRSLCEFDFFDRNVSPSLPSQFITIYNSLLQLICTPLTTHTLVQLSVYPHPLMKSPHCFACWESTNSALNPLIRPCLGCKDSYLIHSNCIDRHLFLIAKSGAGSYLESGPATPRCSRCLDVYKTTVKTVPIFTSLREDKFLASSLIFLILSISILVYYCLSLLGNLSISNAYLELSFRIRAILPTLNVEDDEDNAIAIEEYGLSLILTILTTLCVMFIGLLIPSSYSKVSRCLLISLFAC
jgi:hypothetical protein